MNGYRLAPGAAEWAAGYDCGADPRFFANENIAQMINDAAVAGIIRGGPPGATLMADCTADSGGCPDGWRILLRVPHLQCLLAAETGQACGDNPGRAELLAGAVAEANTLAGQIPVLTGRN